MKNGIGRNGKWKALEGISGQIGAFVVFAFFALLRWTGVLCKIEVEHMLIQDEKDSVVSDSR